jgi:hypothetical protein
MSEQESGQLGRLANTLAAAKCDEADAKAKRVAIEEEIAKLIKTPDTGQATVRVNGGKVKLTVKRGMNYTADCAKLSEIAKKLGLHAPIKTEEKTKLDEKGYEWYRDNNKEAFAALSKHVTAKPKKVAVTLKDESA